MLKRDGLKRKSVEKFSERKARRIRGEGEKSHDSRGIVWETGPLKPWGLVARERDLKSFFMKR